MEGITDSMGMSLSKLWGRVKEREAWGAAVHGVAKSQIMTERLNNNNKGVEATLVCKINHKPKSKKRKRPILEVQSIAPKGVTVFNYF